MPSATYVLGFENPCPPFKDFEREASLTPSHILPSFVITESSSSLNAEKVSLPFHPSGSESLPQQVHDY